MPYRIRALRNGHCHVREDVTFADRIGRTGTHLYWSYLWIIEGPGLLAAVDTGIKDPTAFNAATAEYIIGGLRHDPGETTPEALAAAGIDPADINTLFLTHTHPDHCGYVELFPNATLFFSRAGLLHDFPRSAPRAVLEPLMNDWPARLRLTDDREEVFPGIVLHRAGGHSFDSHILYVETDKGRAAICGDNVYMYANLEENRPIGWADPAETRPILEQIAREADFILPGHDPKVFERHPGGLVAW